ncbi:MAG: hypothetical protein PHT07_20870 [Paludibacter sp.]|nr:hypothetical protein [Paludibacter sp.]
MIKTKLQLRADKIESRHKSILNAIEHEFLTSEQIHAIVKSVCLDGIRRDISYLVLCKKIIIQQTEGTRAGKSYRAVTSAFNERTQSAVNQSHVRIIAERHPTKREYKTGRVYVSGSTLTYF